MIFKHRGLGSQANAPVYTESSLEQRLSYYFFVQHLAQWEPDVFGASRHCYIA